MDYKLDMCGGCMTCEIACSYKHTGEFNHFVSSIEIIELKESPGYKVRIHEKSNGERIACNGCIDIEGEPMCVRYCHKYEDLKDIINRFNEAHCLQAKK